MDPAWIEFIKTFGLPTAGCVFLCIILSRMSDRMMKNSDKLTETIEKNVEIMTAEVKKIDPKLDRIEEHVKKQICQAGELQVGKRTQHE
jgi:hypothetical protein